MQLNATKCYYFSLHTVTYLVNFHPKQSQKSMFGFIPPLHFLGGMCIAIALLPQEKTNNNKQQNKQKSIAVMFSFKKGKNVNTFFQCIPYNINRVFR